MTVQGWDKLSCSTRIHKMGVLETAEQVGMNGQMRNIMSRLYKFPTSAEHIASMRQFPIRVQDDFKSFTRLLAGRKLWQSFAVTVFVAAGMYRLVIGSLCSL